MTPRSVRDELTNILDFLVESRLALYANPVSISGKRVSFHQHLRDASFLDERGDPSIGQYVAWVSAGAYSALLFDGGLLQLTYDVDAGSVVGHRLAYVPCPYDIDPGLFDAGFPLAEIVESYVDAEPVLRSPIRFDFDPSASRPGHPAAHLTLNSSDCRIACVAPMHALRFVDFVFRNFHEPYWNVHRQFFESANTRHLAHRRLDDIEATYPHLMWNQDSLSLS